MSKFSDLIRKWDDPILKRTCIHVEPGEDTAPLVALLDLACRKNRGAGLAAPQVGHAKRVIFTLVDGGKGVRGRAFINPFIILHSGESTVESEGCLSYPGIRKPIRRWNWIDLMFKDTQGRELRERFTGFPARVIQHEVDHLDGICRVGDGSAAEAMRRSRSTSVAVVTAAAMAIGGLK